LRQWRQERARFTSKCHAHTVANRLRCGRPLQKLPARRRKRRAENDRLGRVKWPEACRLTGTGQEHAFQQVRQPPLVAIERPAILDDEQPVDVGAG
jgi:hypothetical protein